MVTTGTFQAARSRVGRLPLLGISQRIVLVAPTRESASGATRWCSQCFPGRPSESENTSTSNSSGSCSIAARRLFTFSPQLTGCPAINVGLDARTLRYSVDDAFRGISLGSQDEEDFVVLPFEFR